MNIIIRLSSYKNNVHPIIITGQNGMIKHYNSIASIYLGKGNKKGLDFLEYLEDDTDYRKFQRLMKVSLNNQPYVAYNVCLEGIEEEVTVRFYQHLGRFYNYIILERTNINEDLWRSEENRKWAERLQIMLSGLSHELKTPLATARGYAELLDDEYKDNILDVLNKMADILEDMSEPLEAVESDRSTFDVAQSIEKYTDTMNYTDPVKRYVGHFDVDIESAKGKYINMSKTRFYQVLTNLFKNAIKATEGMGVDAQIKLNSKECNKPHHHNCLIIEFSDNGKGMTPEQKRKVFTPYFTTREGSSGTGLGGYFIYHMIHDAGGEVNVETEKNEGTTFKMHLPYISKEEV